MRSFIIIILFFLPTTQFVFGQDGFIGQTPALAYWTVGNKDQVVIVLHGGPGAGHEYLRPEWDSLSKIAKVVYYDQRGCGKSEEMDCYSWKAQIDDLKKVVSMFSNGKKVILAGSSWGTMLALLYSLYYPEDVKGMILSGTVAWLGEGMPLKDCSSYMPDYQKYLRVGIDTALQYISLKYKYTMKSPLHPDTTFYRKVKEDKCYTVPFYARVGTLTSLKDAPTLSDLQKIAIPTLIFQSNSKCEEPSFLKDASSQYAILPKSQFFTIEGACHDPWFTHSKAFFQKCLDFIMTLELEHG